MFSDITSASRPKQGHCHLVLDHIQDFLVVPIMSFVVMRSSPGPHVTLSHHLFSFQRSRTFLALSLTAEILTPLKVLGLSFCIVPPRGCLSFRPDQMRVMLLRQENHKSDVWFARPTLSVVQDGYWSEWWCPLRLLGYGGVCQHLPWELALLPFVINGNLVWGTWKLGK